GFRFLETCFQNHKEPEHNWEFYYLQVVDASGQTLAMAVFTLSLWKDDLLAKPNLSLQIEKQREKEKYFLTSKVLGLGSLFSDGLPLYIKKDHGNQEKVIAVLLNSLEEIANNHKA